MSRSGITIKDQSGGVSVAARPAVELSDTGETRYIQQMEPVAGKLGCETNIYQVSDISRYLVVGGGDDPSLAKPCTDTVLDAVLGGAESALYTLRVYGPLSGFAGDTLYWEILLSAGVLSLNVWYNSDKTDLIITGSTAYVGGAKEMELTGGESYPDNSGYAYVKAGITGDITAADLAVAGQTIDYPLLISTRIIDCGDKNRLAILPQQYDDSLVTSVTVTPVLFSRNGRSIIGILPPVTFESVSPINEFPVQVIDLCGADSVGLHLTAISGPEGDSMYIRGVLL